MIWQVATPSRPSRLSRRAGGRTNLNRPYRASMTLRAQPRMTQVVERPELDQAVEETHEPKWLVTVYNNETNTYEEVIAVLCIATGCTPEEAYIEAWEIDQYGQCVVHRADEDTCKTVAEIIATIGIGVEATPED